MEIHRIVETLRGADFLENLDGYSQMFGVDALEKKNEMILNSDDWMQLEIF